MINLLLTFFLFLNFLSYSQLLVDSTLSFTIEKDKHLIFYNSEGLSISNFLTLKPQKALLFKETINCKTLQNIKYQKNNFYLFLLKNELNYFYKPDTMLNSDDLGMHFSLGRQQFFSVYANNNTAKLLLLGNKALAGDSISLNFRLINYDNFYLTIGIFQLQNIYNKLKTFANFDINLHYLQKIQQLKISESKFYTSVDGTTINTKIKGEYNDNLTKKNICYGLSFSGEIYALSNDYLFSFTFKNLGFFKLNNKSLYAKADTFINYEGIFIDYNEKEILLKFPLNIDSLKSKVIDTTSSIVLIPSFFNLKFTKYHKSKWLILSEANIKYFSFINQRIPSISLKQHYRNSKNLTTVFQIEYSILSKLIGELGFNLNYKKLNTQIFIKFPMNFIFNNYCFSTGINIELSYSL
ncbi:MAG: hypothetical protein N3A01_02145 [Bacteroidales bacterium]|nr:hypothetical protein [Bacteroidales bacterium]